MTVIDLLHALTPLLGNTSVFAAKGILEMEKNAEVRDGGKIITVISHTNSTMQRQ